jgi:signal peptidase I
MSGGAMLPTIPLGARMSYGKYNSSADVARGDIAIFLHARSGTQFVSRLVGLPGDRIQMRDGQLILNETAVKRERIEDYVNNEGGQQIHVRRWRETLPEGASYATLDLADSGLHDNTPVYTVPAGSYFLLGDNRDNATDSRVMSQIGFIPFRDIIGRVMGF